MIIDLNTRLKEITAQLETHLQDENPDFKKSIELYISVSILYGRTMEKRQEDERMAANERRTQSTNELAGTYQSFKSWSTLIVIAQAAATVGGPLCAGKINGIGVPNDLISTFLQGTSQAIGSIKGLNDESIKSRQEILRHTIDKTKMFGDDLGRDAQRSQTHVSELLGLRKQIDNEEHSAASRP